jgi:hypothetical protein
MCLRNCPATVDRNSSPTNVEVIFSLTGFPPNARNVYVRVRDTIWPLLWPYDRVVIDSQGAGADTWKPQEFRGIPEFRGHNKRLSIEGADSSAKCND